MALTSFSDFVTSNGIAKASQVLNHAWLAKGQGTTDFYYLEVDQTTGALPFSSVPFSPTIRHNIYSDYGTTPVTTSAYTEILAATLGQTLRLWIQDTSGSMLILATGSAASEVPLVYIQAGGFGFQVDLTIPSGSRLSLKALDADATSGAFLATLMG